MTTKNVRYSIQERERLIDDVRGMLGRGTPEDIVLRNIIHRTKYSLSGARNLIKEAHMRMDMPGPKNRRLE